MHTISPMSMLLIAIVILVLFGRGKISSLMGEAGKGITAFRKGLDDTNPTSANDTTTDTEKAPAGILPTPTQRHAQTLPDPNNPNRCAACLGDKVPAEGYAVADTGRCGRCGETNEVWDLPHLADLAATGKTVHDPADQHRRINRPIRDSHLVR